MEFFERALESAERAGQCYQQAINNANTGRYPVLHERVCGILVLFYRYYLSELRCRLDGTFQGCTTLPHDLLPSLRELLRIMHNGEHFVLLCCDSNAVLWPQRAMLLAPSRDGFLVHLHDFFWCYWVIEQAIHAVAGTETEAYWRPATLNSRWSEEDERLALRLSGKLEDYEKEDADALIQTLLKMTHERTSQGDHIYEHRISELLIDLLADSRRSSNQYLIRIPRTEFTLKEVLGWGSFGCVQNVEWLGAEFAEKTIRGTSNLESFDEAAILATLGRHPHAVFTLGYCISDERCSVVMERMDHDLAKFIEMRRKRHNPPFRLPVAVDIMLQIAKGMAYIHSKNIIHRDLKPQNILVNLEPVFDERGSLQKWDNEDGWVRVKLTDFGESKLKEPNYSKFSTPKIGTGFWRAPELLASEEATNTKYTLKADVYSFAIVCFEVLTGEQPWGNRKSNEGWRPTWPPAARVPVYLSSYIGRCWDDQPTSRPSFAEIYRTLRHVKGALLRCQSPENVPLLSSFVSIEPPLISASTTIYAQLFSMPIEMSTFRVMEEILLKPNSLSEEHCGAVLVDN